MTPKTIRYVSVFLAAGLLIALPLGLALATAPNLDLALARYPGSRPVGEQEFDLFWLQRGVALSGTFRMRDNWLDVWRWYQDQLGLEPQKTNGLNVRTMCQTLAQDSQQFLMRRVTSVALCAKRAGTVVYVQRTLSFEGFSQVPALLLPRPPSQANAPNRNRP